MTAENKKLVQENEAKFQNAQRAWIQSNHKDDKAWATMWTCIYLACENMCKSKGKGIVIPNLAAFLQGDHFQKNMGAVLLLGPIFLLFCDILARLIIAPYEIPVSIIVGVIGAGMFIFILLRGERA